MNVSLESPSLNLSGSVGRVKNRKKKLQGRNIKVNVPAPTLLVFLTSGATAVPRAAASVVTKL